MPLSPLRLERTYAAASHRRVNPILHEAYDKGTQNVSAPDTTIQETERRAGPPLSEQ
jgi:hypothetical protein